MLSKIISFSIKNKLVVALFLIALVAHGSYSFTKLPIDAVPDITNNQVQIITVAPSYAATDIERLVTFPLEQANSNIAGLKEIRSFSRFGLSLVTIVFNDDVDVYWARQQVAERLQLVQNNIPKDIGMPTLGPISTGLGEIYQYVVKPKKGYENKYNITELRTIQDWIIRRQLIGVKGVAEVSSFGGKLKQYQIEIDPNKLQSYNISIADVFGALENNNQNTGGAYIEKNSTVLYIRSEGLINSIDDIKNIAIKNTNAGNPLFIRDVADVNIGNALRYGAMCYNNEGEVSGAVVMMLKGANSNEVIKNVKEKIAAIQLTLPEGVMIEPFLDRTKMVNNAIATVTHNLLEGALIVVFVLVLFLGNFRAGFIVASVIPLAMLFAIILMNLFGVSGNLMSLGALDFGLIVDGAVIIVEGVMHSIAHNKHFKSIAQLSQLQMDKEVDTAASKMMNSAVFGQIIILVVYLPIFTLQGIEGKMFKPMAQTVAFALLGAFILSLTYIPMMSAIFLSKKIKHQSNLSDKLMHKVEHFYELALNKILHFPKTIVAAAIAMFIIAATILTFLGGEFIPALEEGDFAVETRVLTGSNLTTTITNTQKAAGILKNNFPEVEKVVTKIGSGEVPTDPMPIDAADMMVILKDKKEWTSATTFNELSAKMSKALEDLPGVATSFQYPVQMRFNELMTGAKQDVVCKIFGENLDTLTKYAALLGGITNSIHGAKDIYIEPVLGNPQLAITYNRNSLAQYNVNIAYANKIVNTALAGQSAGVLYEGEKPFDIVVKLKSDLKKSATDIANILIPTQNGIQIPLYQIATVQEVESPNQIQREDAKRRIVVGFNVKDADVQTVVQELQQKIAKQIKFPSGYYVTYGGSFENLNAAKARLSIAVPVSLLLIFLLLYFAFNSIKQGLLIYSAIPLSAIGGILFLAFRGMPFSISAGVGFIALFGVAVLNGIVLIAEFNQLKIDGIYNVKQRIIMGTKIRLRPILMTAFVASLGFLPMAVSNGAGAEVQRPLATVVIGGLLIATFLTLFVLPSLYLLFEKQKTKVIMPKTISLIFISLLLSIMANAQEKISLNAAIKIAKENNLIVKKDKQTVSYFKSLSTTATAIPTTNVVVEYGKINSAYNDSKFTITQSFALPTVYKQHQNLLQQEWKTSELKAKVGELELQKQVTKVYVNWLYLLQKKKLLQKIDSLYANLYNAATLKLQKGEGNIVEQTFAKTQLNNASLQIINIDNDIEIFKQQFNVLLNTTNSYIVDETIALLPNNFTEQSTITQHPILQMLQQEHNVTKANVAVEKSKLLPEFSVGYSNASIQGMGADNVLYNSSKRFGAMQLGAAIPIFSKAQKNKIKTAEIATSIALQNIDIEQQQLNLQLNNLMQQHKKNLSIINLFNTSTQTNIATIITSATHQLTNGNINYIEWAQLINQTINSENDYIEAVKNYNEVVAEINYITSK